MKTAATLALAQAINPATLRARQPDGTWLVYEPGDTLPQPSAAQLLADAKAARIHTNRAACQAHILATYPQLEQISLVGGVYGATKQAKWQDDVQACIVAENAAAALIDNATTVAQVEAVTLTLPVIAWA